MRLIIMPISKILKEVRTYDLYSQQYIADMLNIQRGTYACYESNKRIIPLKHLNTLANFYNLSIDYLLGLTDNKKAFKKVELDIEKSSKNLKLVRNELGLTTRDLSKSLNVENSTISDYENGVYFISTHACYDLARKYNISVDWLLGKSDIKYID